MQHETDDKERNDTLNAANTTRREVECLRCGDVSRAGERAPALGCSDGPNGAAEHYWTETDDGEEIEAEALVEDAGDDQPALEPGVIITWRDDDRTKRATVVEVERNTHYADAAITVDGERVFEDDLLRTESPIQVTELVPDGGQQVAEADDETGEDSDSGMNISDAVKLTDRANMVGIADADLPERTACFPVDRLQTALELVDTLGWETVDLYTVESSCSDPHEALALRPVGSGWSPPQPAVVVAPFTEDGREAFGGGSE